MEEDESTENLSLDYESSDLTDNIEDDETELSPPDEENTAKQLNVTNIVMVIGFAAAIIIGLIVIMGKIHTKKAEDNSELDKAGNKYIPDITLKDKQLPLIDSLIESEDKNAFEKEMKNKKDVDEIINNLPEDFQQPVSGTAPLNTGSSAAVSYKSDRPDTRNSNSIRKIEGIGGQEYTNATANNQSIIADAMNGYAGGKQQRISKEEYIAQLMRQSSAVNSSYGSKSYGNQNAGAVNQGDKESFYRNSNGQAGQGQYLSYASLWDGTIITGALVTAVNTDNPGVIIARVTENVYSSYDNSFLLVPEGTLLYATYNSSISYGQDRVQIAWNLLIRPDGYRMELGNMNGVDAQGQSGTQGKVTNHPFETLKALGMVAVFSVIQTELTNDIKSQNNEYLQNSMSDVYAEASKLGNKIVDRALNIKPTITIKQGTQIKFITNIPLELPPVKVNQVNRKYVRTK
ncbi:MAG: TrbI/VirB10 family protein [Bacteroides sp.]|nr:TrbI/VirB10 family protein [Prevotella sp.]MCM1407023.1 TrbI/VirB10 family protein [Treponema brennaborense]MCM1470175.1 TrbI/VirB10 family protein [Bacteroides sp.]